MHAYLHTYIQICINADVSEPCGEGGGDLPAARADREDHAAAARRAEEGGETQPRGARDGERPQGALCCIMHLFKLCVSTDIIAAQAVGVTRSSAQYFQVWQQWNLISNLHTTSSRLRQYKMSPAQASWCNTNYMAYARMVVLIVCHQMWRRIEQEVIESKDERIQELESMVESCESERSVERRAERERFIRMEDVLKVEYVCIHECVCLCAT